MSSLAPLSFLAPRADPGLRLPEGRMPGPGVAAGWAFPDLGNARAARLQARPAPAGAEADADALRGAFMAALCGAGDTRF